MVKVGSNPIWRAYSRSSRAPMAWKVPAQLSAPVSGPANAPPEAGRFAPKASLPMRWTRRVISTAARRENVMSRIRRGSAPLAARCTTRWASVLVLPDPAPAITRSAASVAGSQTPCSTARRWSGLSLSR
jgi:hypothetical protein